MAKTYTVNCASVNRDSIKAYWFNPSTNTITFIGTYSRTTRPFTSPSGDQVLIIDAYVSTAPKITINPKPINFGNVTVNVVSSAQTYTLSGANLSPTSGSIIVTAPTDYEVSKTQVGNYSAPPITYAYTGNAISTSTVYVRFLPTVVQDYSGNVANSDGGADIKNVAVTGTGIYYYVIDYFNRAKGYITSP